MSSGSGRVRVTMVVVAMGGWDRVTVWGLLAMLGLGRGRLVAPWGLCRVSWHGGGMTQLRWRWSCGCGMAGQGGACVPCWGDSTAGLRSWHGTVGLARHVAEVPQWAGGGRALHVMLE